MKTILVDWSLIQDEEAFYASVLPQTDAPGWHGHNLNAILDSWLRGGICSSGPPFSFVFRHSKNISPGLKEFAETICGFAENCVMEHGGEVTYEDSSAEQACERVRQL
jgi:hypothetical protein